jgi:hypothetical protein
MSNGATLDRRGCGWFLSTIRWQETIDQFAGYDGGGLGREEPPLLQLLEIYCALAGKTMVDKFPENYESKISYSE